MYGPAAGAPPRGGPPSRQFTPRGQMSGGANQRPPLMDLAPGMKLMFEPRPPIPYMPPPMLTKKPTPPYTGIAQYAALFEKDAPPTSISTVETPHQRKDRLRQQVTSIESHLVILIHV